jgi:outer membrane protein
MKKSTIFTVVILALLLTGFNANAQLKIGHIDSQELLAAMPESDSATKKLQKLAKDHEARLEEMQVEFNKKYQELLDYMKDEENVNELVQSTKEEDLELLQKRIMNFQQTAQQDLEKKRMELFQPIQEKALNAVNEVAEENGYTYILDSGIGVIVYAAEDANDILPLVKKKLGLE